MLIPVTPNTYDPNTMTEDVLKVWESFTEAGRQALIASLPYELQRGVYHCGSNAQDEVKEPLDDFFSKRNANLLHERDDERSPWDWHKANGWSKHVSTYGICDSVENLLTHPDYTPLLNGPRNFTVFVTEFRKEDSGDFRWHKNGPYIGTQNPQCEHLGDEPEIETIFMFHILEHIRTPQQIWEDEQERAMTDAEVHG